jgi:hypothetical protein
MVFIKVIEKELGLLVIKEFYFNPARKWRFDYYIPDLRTGIEVEGGSFKKTWYKDKKTGLAKCHTGGRHNTGEGFINDMEKYNSAAVLGYSVLRVTPDQLLTSKTIENIKALKELKTK